GRVVAVTLRAEGARVMATVPAAAWERRKEALPGVVATMPWEVPVPLNDDSIWVGQSYDTVGHATPIFAHGVTGTGEVVAVYDTGADPDACQFVFAPGQWSPAQALVPPDIGTLHPNE